MVAHHDRCPLEGLRFGGVIMLRYRRMRQVRGIGRSPLSVSKAASNLMKTADPVPSMASITIRDYTLVMGVVLIYSFLIILLNLAADLTYRMLDPRSRAA